MASMVALIVDIVGSRELADRDEAQRGVLAAFATAHEARPFQRPLWATAGDEFQAVFADVPAALAATAIARLLLPEGVDCRFGLGRGEIRTVGGDGGESSGVIQDGSAWWSARSAIEEAHRREDRVSPYLRSWFVSAPDVGGAGEDAVVNSYLLMRDQAISGMRPRERRITAGALLGRSQVELAREEGVTQSAVSQSLRRSGGAALLAAHQLLQRGAPG